MGKPAIHQPCTPNRRLSDVFLFLTPNPGTPSLKLRRTRLLKIDVLAGRLAGATSPTLPQTAPSPYPTVAHTPSRKWLTPTYHVNKTSYWAFGFSCRVSFTIALAQRWRSVERRSLVAGYTVAAGGGVPGKRRQRPRVQQDADWANQLSINHVHPIDVFQTSFYL